MKKLALLITLLIAAGSSAQESASVTIRTLCFQRDAAGIDKLAVRVPELPVVEMKFPESFFSPKTKVPVTGGKVFFYNAAEKSGAPIAVANIPSDLKSVFILFFPVEGDKDKMVYRTSVMDASLQGIPPDGAMILNLFPKEVRVVVGEHRIALKPGNNAGVARPKDRNDYNMSPVVFLAENNGDWKVVSETLVRFPEQLQQFFIAYPDGPSGRLSFRAIQIDNI